MPGPLNDTSIAALVSSCGVGSVSWLTSDSHARGTSSHARPDCTRYPRCRAAAVLTCGRLRPRRLVSSALSGFPMNDRDFERDVEPPVPSAKRGFLLRKLPYIAVLALTILGTAYTSMSQHPLVGYWEFVALATGVVCVTTGRANFSDRQARFRLMWTQAIHWTAILVAMNIVLLPGVQRMLTGPATGLALLLLLALGTFLAGVQVSLQIAFLGLVMASLVPAIAWLKQSILFIVLAVATVAALGFAFWWRQPDEIGTNASRRQQILE